MVQMWLVIFTGATGSALTVLVAERSMDKAIERAKATVSGHESSSLQIKNLGRVPDLVVGFDEEVV